jgi:cytochrome c oxidase assembly protein subunit 15
MVQPATAPASPWPHRLATATALLAVPLFVFGGSVTTLRAGMAVDGWIFPEGHFLVTFPVEKWFRNLPTFVEHTHRLFGVLVGLAAIAALAACIVTRAGARATLLAGLALAAVCAQGALGGLRVLENSSQLAFLHGVCAQLVFALLGVVAWQLRPGWRALGDVEYPEGPTLRRTAIGCTVLLLGQIALGAWYRHGLRTQQLADVELRLSLHLVGALAAFAAVLVLAGRLQSSAEARALVLARRLRILLFVQLGLGLGAWLLRDPRGMTPAEWGTSVLHVLVGALLFLQAARAWALSSAREPATNAAELPVGGAA